MSVSLSTFSNDSHPHSKPFALHCLVTRPGSLIFTTFAVTNTLFLLPLCLLILYLGLQRRRQQRSSSTAASHSDSFTYHLVAMELLNVCGGVVGCCSIYKGDVQMMMVWFYTFCFNWCGEMLFHLLTCAEHYLAVVHPVTYLSLRKERGIRIRNVSVGCVWLLCFGGTVLTIMGDSYIIVDLSLLIVSIIITSFCCLSVLCVLISPGPGGQSRERERVDQSKQRAFYTIMTILGVLWVRFVWNVAAGVQTFMYGLINGCLVALCAVWINLPSSLVLPLLFLQRAGTLAAWMNNLKGIKD